MEKLETPSIWKVACDKCGDLFIPEDLIWVRQNGGKKTYLICVRCLVYLAGFFLGNDVKDQPKAE